MTVFLIKPHPPPGILERSCPAAEKYKYAWEPVSLKILACLIKKNFPGIETEIWHLIKKEDDLLLSDRIKNKKPELVIFSDMDITVNEINTLARRVKEIDPRIITVTGGKHSSTLRKGDVFPFHAIDAAFRGGPDALLHYIKGLRDKTDNTCIKGRIKVDTHGIVCDDNSFSGRSHLDKNSNQVFDNAEMRKIPVANQTDEAYINEHQAHPSILEGAVRTSPVYSGEGCPYNCVFCQSPIEFEHGGKSLLCGARTVAGEISWLIKKHRVNNFFFLEPNLDLDHLLEIYTILDSMGIHYAAVSGFIRAADIIKYHKNKTLEAVVKKGLRVVSVGLDIPVDSREDVWKKSFSYTEMMESLAICREYGILVLATSVGDPDVTPDQFAAQLSFIKTLPVADMDIRLAMAIRNTGFYQRNKQFLLHKPDVGSLYFDRQNYRYQTLQFPGRITPEETYSLLGEFYRSFYFYDTHLAYVGEMLEKHSDTLPFFQRQYRDLAGPEGFAVMKKRILTAKSAKFS